MWSRVELWSKLPSLHWSQGFKEYSKHNKRNEHLKFALVWTWLFMVLGVAIWFRNSIVRLATFLCNFCMQNRRIHYIIGYALEKHCIKGIYTFTPVKIVDFMYLQKPSTSCVVLRTFLYLRGITLPWFGLFCRHVFLLKNQNVTGRTIWSLQGLFGGPNTIYLQIKNKYTKWTYCRWHETMSRKGYYEIF